MSNERTEMKRATRQSDTSSRLGISLASIKIVSPYYSLLYKSVILEKKSDINGPTFWCIYLDTLQGQQCLYGRIGFFQGHTGAAAQVRQRFMAIYSFIKTASLLIRNVYRTTGKR